MRQASTHDLRTARPGDLRETISEQRPWLALLFLLNSLDMATTALGLQLGIPEGNPIQASLLAGYGELALLLSKIVLLAGLILVLHLLRARYRRLWPFWLAMTVPTLLVVTNNLALVVHALL